MANVEVSVYLHCYPRNILGIRPAEYSLSFILIFLFTSIICLLIFIYICTLYLLLRSYGTLGYS